MMTKTSIRPPNRYREPANVNGGFPLTPILIATRSDAKIIESNRKGAANFKRDIKLITIEYSFLTPH